MDCSCLDRRVVGVRRAPPPPPPIGLPLQREQEGAHDTPYDSSHLISQWCKAIPITLTCYSSHPLQEKKILKITLNVAPPPGQKPLQQKLLVWPTVEQGKVIITASPLQQVQVSRVDPGRGAKAYMFCTSTAEKLTGLQVRPWLLRIPPPRPPRQDPTQTSQSKCL